MKRKHTGKAIEAFTLIELLGVMTILAVLFAILFPAVGRARLAAARSQARQEMSDIVSAFRNYFNEYGRYPFQSNTNVDRDYFPKNRYIEVIDLLRMADSLSPADIQNENPRKIVFLTVNDGSLDDDGVFVDPWKNRYQVVVDWTLDNRVDINAQGYQTIQGRSVVAWSWGSRGSDAQNEPLHHIKSWTDDPNDHGS